MKKFIFAVQLLFLVNALVPTAAQNKVTEQQYPEIGKPMPYFHLSHVKGYETTEISSKSLIGKKYVLDFWTLGCGACVASFPKMDSLYKKYKSQLGIFSVGLQDKDSAIQKMFLKFKNKQQLSFPYTFIEENLFDRIVPRGVPHLIWVNEQGIVVAITLTATEPSIISFSEGKPFEFVDKSYKSYQTKEILAQQPALSTEKNTLFHATISTFDHDKMKVKVTNLDDRYMQSFSDKDSFVYEFTGGKLAQLYKMAIFGHIELLPSNWDSSYYTHYRDLVLEINDTSHFAISDTYTTNIFNFSLQLKNVNLSLHKIRHIITNTLDNYFGYTTHIEVRNMPYWALTATPETLQKLKTKSNQPPPKFYQFPTGYRAGFTASNMPVKRLVDLLAGTYWKEEFFDETGMLSNIDIKVDAILTDFDDFRSALQHNGLMLVRKSKPMKVVVIRDTPSENTY